MQQNSTNSPYKALMSQDSTDIYKKPSQRRNNSKEVSKMVKVDYSCNEGNCFTSSAKSYSNRNNLTQKIDSKDKTNEEHITLVREDLKGRIDKLDIQMRKFEKDNLQETQYPLNRPSINNAFLSPEAFKKHKFLDQSNLIPNTLKETMNSSKYSILNNSTYNSKLNNSVSSIKPKHKKVA